MRIIDFHTHIFPDHLAARAMKRLSETSGNMPYYHDGTLAGLKASMRQSGVSQSVLLPVATKPEQVAVINKSCADLFSDETIPFGTLFPGDPGFEGEIDRMKNLGVKGIKLHPEYQSFYVDDRKYFPMYEALQAAAMIVVFHAGSDPGPFEKTDHATPAALARVKQNFPRLRMVAAHMGGWKMWNEAEALLRDTGMYFDTAAIKGDMRDEAQFVRMARVFGTDRIVFATDSPWYEQLDVVRWIDGLPFTDEGKEKIFFRNAELLLGL
jgi:hypothetical protein